jgi:hypothetical protein
MVVIVDFAEIDIISDILSIDVFPFVPEGERDNFVLADDTAVLVDSLCTCLSVQDISRYSSITAIDSQHIKTLVSSTADESLPSSMKSSYILQVSSMSDKQVQSESTKTAVSHIR